jgi:hypothetical protein
MPPLRWLHRTLIVMATLTMAARWTRTPSAACRIERSCRHHGSKQRNHVTDPTRRQPVWRSIADQWSRSILVEALHTSIARTSAGLRRTDRGDAPCKESPGSFYGRHVAGSHAASEAASMRFLSFRAQLAPIAGWRWSHRVGVEALVASAERVLATTSMRPEIRSRIARRLRREWQALELEAGGALACGRIRCRHAKVRRADPRPVCMNRLAMEPAGHDCGVALARDLQFTPVSILQLLHRLARLDHTAGHIAEVASRHWSRGLAVADLGARHCRAQHGRAGGAQRAALWHGCPPSTPRPPCCASSSMLGTSASRCAARRRGGQLD